MEFSKSRKKEKKEKKTALLACSYDNSVGCAATRLNNDCPALEETNGKGYEFYLRRFIESSFVFLSLSIS